MENNIEQKIIAYECNVLKQAFFNRDVFNYLLERIPEQFFQNQIREVLWRAYVFINSNDEEITRSTVEDVFIKSNNSEHIEKIWAILEGSYPDEPQWKYHFRYLHEIYAKANILKVIEDVKKKLATGSISTLIETIIIEVSKYEMKDDDSVKLTEAANMAMKDVVDRMEGRISPFIRTGNDRFDNLLKMDFHEIILFASAKKIGKTKLTLHLIMEILEIDPSIAVKIYSFELSEKELMYEFVSRETELRSSEIQSKGYKLSQQELIKIKDTMNKIAALDIEISTKPVSIETVKKDFIKFCKKRGTTRAILIIDNIGLLKDHKGTQTETDDYVSKVIVEIKDRTKGLIIPIHHMVKDMEKEERLKDGYRPRLEHLKGSTRIQDYANKVVLLHRPGHYEDLVKREESKGLIYLNEGKFSRGEVIRKLFIAEVALNRNGEKGIVRFLHKLQFCQFKEWK